MSAPVVLRGRVHRPSRQQVEAVATTAEAREAARLAQIERIIEAAPDHALFRCSGCDHVSFAGGLRKYAAEGRKEHHKNFQQRFGERHTERSSSPEERPFQYRCSQCGSREIHPKVPSACR